MSLGRHVTQLFEAVEQPIPASNERIIEDFDWPAFGVTHRYVIFMTGRCGSTWLASLLKNTRLAGFPTEFFNEKAAASFYDRSAHGLAGYFEQIVRQHSSNNRFGLKIDGERLKQIEEFINWPTVFPAGQTFTMFLFRRDLLAQAWSWVSARKGGKFHNYARSPSEAASVSPTPLVTTRELVDEMVRIRRHEEYLEFFFAKHDYQPYYLDYESLMANPIVNLTLVLRFLELDTSDTTSSGTVAHGDTSKLTYSDKDQILADFAFRNKELMLMLQKDRLRISSKVLSALVA